MIQVLLSVIFIQVVTSQDKYGIVVPHTLVAYVGDGVGMSCISFDVPVWIKEGEKNQYFNRTLIIKNVNEDDSGVYICRGTLNREREVFTTSSKLFVGGT